MSDLLHCPFCGGQAEIHSTHDIDTGEIDGWFVWCNNSTCECAPETNDHFTEAEAITAWNARAERTCRMEYSGGVHEFLSLDTWTCSECGCEMYDATEPNYCPTCGARVVSE